MAELQACLDDVEIFADLDGKRASDSPPATIPLLYWYVLTGLTLFYMMQNQKLFHCWNLPAHLILVLIFLLHENVSRKSQNTNKLLLSWIAWAL